MVQGADEVTANPPGLNSHKTKRSFASQLGPLGGCRRVRLRIELHKTICAVGVDYNLAHTCAPSGWRVRRVHLVWRCANVCWCFEEMQFVFPADPFCGIYAPHMCQRDISMELSSPNGVTKNSLVLNSPLFLFFFFPPANQTAVSFHDWLFFESHFKTSCDE